MAKNKNPFIINKDSSPYLYLSEYSGIYINNYEADTLNRGIEIKLNKGLQSNFKVAGIQFWVRYPELLFTASATLIDVIGVSSSAQINMIPETGQARGFLQNSNSEIGFFQNGIKVENAILYPRQWIAVMATFFTPIDMANFEGSINIYPGFVFNNISVYSYEDELLDITKTAYKIWNSILIPDVLSPLVEEQWSAYSSTTWGQATSKTVPNDYTIDGSQVYNNQIGISIVTVEDDSKISVYSNGINILTDISWETIDAELV